jgi:hypothetical protein
MSDLPEDVKAEIEAAVDAAGPVVVPARCDDLAPLVARHRELSGRSDLDEAERLELASLSDLLDVANRDGWHVAPKGGEAAQ